MAHPYKQMPPIKFWSKAVSSHFDLASLYQGPTPLIATNEKVMSAGSCFAAELVPYLERHGLTYLRTEYQHDFYRWVPQESLSYGRFSAGYGNIYTARQLLQLFRRSQGRFKPQEDRWPEQGIVIDPFRPGLKYIARSDQEFDALTNQHLAATASAFQQCDVLIFTLGLTEAWVSKIDGAVFPVCPGTIAGTFDASKHEFHNFSTAEQVDDLNAFIKELREVNPGVRVILTVSPVPLVATASDAHVLVATTYSKSALRVVAEEVRQANKGVSYFPSYEIVTGPQAPDSYFKNNKRDVSREAVDAVMFSFLNSCKIDREIDFAPGRQATSGEAEGQSKQSSPHPLEQAPGASVAAMLSARVAAIECEEAGSEI